MSDQKMKANSLNNRQEIKRTETVFFLSEELNSKSSVIVATEIIMLGAFMDYSICLWV